MLYLGEHSQKCLTLADGCSSPPLRFPLLESLHDVMLQQQPGGFYCRGLLGTRCLPPWQVRYYNVTLQILFFGNANFTIMLDKCSDVNPLGTRAPLRPWQVSRA